MSNTSATEYVKRVIEINHKIAKEASDYFFRVAKEEDIKATKEFGVYQEKRISDLFHEAVQEFYDAYSPEYYDRAYGLNELLDVHKGPNGSVEYDTVEDLIDSSNMHTDRNGGSLYEKVFVRGWHGGAERGPGHPAPGVPYYRAPYSIYAHWSRPAVRTEPPLEIFRKSVESAESGDILQAYKSITARHFDVTTKKTNDEISRLSAKYFG